MYSYSPTIQGFVDLTRTFSFVDRDMFMRYYGGGVGHGDSVAAAEVTVDPEEVVYETADAPFQFENVDEESDDGGEADDPQESTDEETANVY
jgi:hypothetical protein